MSTATSLSKNSFRSSSSSALKVEEEAMEKQGIVSILGSDYSQGTKPAAASFRRTLSADMSSKKWLAAQNGFKSPMMKKIASSEQLSIISVLDSSSSSEEEEEFDGKKIGQNKKQDDVWSLIMSQNKTRELPPPYVHPLVKKSSSSLSEKSLKICTESLGSETGSDGFSSSETGSEADDSDKVEELSQSQTEQQREKEHLQSSSVSEESAAVAKYNYSAASCKRSVQHRSFPPPLPSLTRSSEGPSLHMHSHRENGRLVLEAVSVPSTKNFHAQRQDGRLRLTLLNTAPSDQHQVQQLKNDEAVILDQKGDKVEEDLEEVFDIFEKEEEENEIEEDEEEEEMDEDDEEMAEEIEKYVTEPQEMGIVIEQAAPKMARGMINVHRSAFIMKKPMGLENQKPTWTSKFNYTPAKLMKVDAAEEEEETTQLPQSLPPRPRVARLIPGRPPPAAASLNAYEYFWRTKPVAESKKNPLTHNCLPLKNNTINKVIASNKPKAYEQQQLVALRNNCKEARRSLLSWEPYCIATT